MFLCHALKRFSKAHVFRRVYSLFKVSKVTLDTCINEGVSIRVSMYQI